MTDSNRSWPWVTHDMKSALWCPSDALKYYQMEAYKGDSYLDCVHCPARYWTDEYTHICAVQNMPKNHMMPPNCTEHDWTKFVMEYV